MSANRPYDNGEQLDREGIPDLETPINQDEGMIAPGDRPKGAEEFGVTADEERAFEPLAQRVTRELPDVGPDDIDLDDAEGGYGGDQDIAETLVGEGALSAEESAMHITDSP